MLISLIKNLIQQIGCHLHDCQLELPVQNHVRFVFIGDLIDIRKVTERDIAYSPIANI